MKRRTSTASFFDSGSETRSGALLCLRDGLLSPNLRSVLRAFEAVVTCTPIVGEYLISIRGPAVLLWESS